MQKLLELFSPYYKYIVTAILIIVPLFQKFPAFRISGTYVSIRLEDFLILGTLLMFSILILLNIKTLFKDKTIRSMILFLVIGLVSLISGIYLNQTVSAKIGLLHWVRRIEYLSLFGVGLTYTRFISRNGSTDKFFEYLLKLLLLINLIVFIYGIGQRYANFPVIITQNEEYSKGVALSWTPGAHINSTFAGHYDLASYLVLTIPLFVSSFFYFKDKKSKIILGLSTFIGFWLFSVAVSRISIIAFLIATTISLFLLKKYKEIIVVGAISIIAFGFSPDLRERYWRIIEVTIQKISSVVVVYAGEDGNVNEDRSTSIRFNVEWPRAIRAFYKNPLLGTGYSSITLATDNDYLRALGETGALGLLAFVLLILNLFKSLIKFEFTNEKINENFTPVVVASMIGSLIGILVTAVFLDIFEASKFAIIFWLLAGLTVGGIYKTQNG